MKVGHIYTVTLGTYSGKYFCQATIKRGNKVVEGFELIRVRTPKTKIDAIRLPSRIHITYWGESSSSIIKNN